MSPNAWSTGKRRDRTIWLCIFRFVVVISVIFPLGTRAVTLKDLYNFNSTYGDSLTEETDDGGSGQINVTVSFPFFNKRHNKLYVNNNGVVSFLKELKTYRPDDFPLKDATPIIAPFWADVDVTEGGRVWYREETNINILKRASREVKSYYPKASKFHASWMFIATWDRVCFYGASGAGENKTNTFQAILITNGRESFVIFNYHKIDWTTGSNSGGDTTTGLGGDPAQAGFNAGDKKTYYEIHGARTNAVLNLTLTSNVDIPGKWFFKVDSAQILGRCSKSGSGSVNLFPSTGSMLGGHMVNVTDPCYNAGDNVTARIDSTNQTFRCEVIDETVATCVFPTIFQTGQVDFSLNINESGWNYTGKYDVVNLVYAIGDIFRENANNWVYTKGTIVTARISWDPTLIPSTVVKIELFSYQELKKGPILKLILSRLEVNNTGRPVSLKLDMIHGSLAVIKISAVTSNKPYRAVPSIWSDVFPVMFDDHSQSEEMCNKWLDSESSLEEVIPGEPCPCTLAQAAGDTGRYQPYPLCHADSKSSTNCLYNPGARDCIAPNFQRYVTNSEICCYDGQGELLDVRGSDGGGTFIRYHYRSQGENIVPFFTYLQQDLLPSLHCCHYSTNETLCKNFLKYRPPTTCQGYEPPAAAQAAGDPHLVTLDGKGYSFNGVGQFVLVEDREKNIVVQVTAQQAKDIDGVLQMATIFTAVAMQVTNMSDKLEIKWEESLPVRVLVNGEETQLSSTSQLNGLTVYKNNTGNNTSELTVVMDSVGMSVLIVATEDLLNIMIMVGSPTLKGQLQGLLGNYNGNQDDDFLSRNGTLLSSNANMKDIHFDFGMTWFVSQNESLFTEEDGSITVNSVPFSDNFVPIFIDGMNTTVTPEISEICGDNVQCIYDLRQTRKISVAQSTKLFEQRFLDRLKDTQPVVRCPYIEQILNGNRTVSVYKVGSNVTFTCNAGYEIPLGHSNILFCKKDGSWSGNIPACARKSIVAGTPILTVWYVVAGGTAASLVIVIIIIYLVIRYIGKKRSIIHRKQSSKSGEYETVELPEIFTPSSANIPTPVFENDSFLESLQKLSSEAGRFRIPRPEYVDPSIYSEYF